MLILNRSQVRSLLPMEACIELMRSAMKAVSNGDTVLPPRQFMAIPHRNGKMGLMPGYSAGSTEMRDVFGVKIVSKYVRAPNDPAGTHVGMVVLFEAERGMPIAMIEGGELTGIRTAATSAMAADVLAQKTARSLLVLGAGEEAYHHIRSFCCIRKLATVRVWARRRDQAATLVERCKTETGPDFEIVDDIESAAAASDLICTTTSATDPIFRGAWLKPGHHLTLVGSAIPSTAEVDDDAVAASRFFVDQISAALLAAGELRRAITRGRVSESHICGEIGGVMNGTIPGRQSATDITLYKSLGVLAQDLWAAHYVLKAAQAAGLGSEIDLNL